MSEELTFEARMEALSDAVLRLESGEESLDESLSIYEDVVKHLKACQAALDAAEQRVKILVERDGRLVEEDFEAEAAD